VFEFFKILLDNEQTEKKVEFNDLFYKEVLSVFLNFLASVEDIEVTEDAEKKNHAIQYNRSLEYSRSLVV